ncbi:hypothetical protein PENTCL1PPCAC_16765, partial [Pristionchus entomophagus]
GYFGYAEIYEAEDFHRPVSTLEQALTVMSARPFTLKQEPLPGNSPEYSLKWPDSMLSATVPILAPTFIIFSMLLPWVHDGSE